MEKEKRNKQNKFDIMDVNDLQNNNGTEAYRQIAFALKEKGVTEEAYKEHLANYLPKLEQKYVDFLLDILFHTFF